ncbi:serine protein kinase RIO [Candidatus Micrarchaeota archaeon]|nr:serine protein kinase RIO [Candidatus Micrarchaeota archaeon]
MIRTHDREFFKIYARVFDSQTLSTIRQMASRGFLNTLDFPIKTGKEGDVYRVTTKSGEHRALKIYRIETSNFRSMQDYIIGDPRFSSFRHSKRGMVYTWCQKEFRNLQDAERAGVRVPHAYKFDKNVLLLEFIGENGVAAPLLKDVKDADWSGVTKKLLLFIKLLYKKAGLVHGDLSEFNVMLPKAEPVMIDMAQAVKLEHPRAREFLKRDLYNLSRFAKKHGVKIDAEKEHERLVSGSSV